VAIYRLLQNSGFGPEDIEGMTAAYEKVLVLLRLRDRTDPVTEIIAKRIIEIAQTGEKDPEVICAMAIKSMDIPSQQTGQKV
jgi:hypothetical protein